MEKRRTFKRLGGKFHHLDFILPLLPDSDTFVDVFGGSGVVILNRKPARMHNVLNDLDGDLVTFFRVLRDDPERLLDAISLTPYSRGEFAFCKDVDAADDVERARRFLVRSCQSFAARPHGSPWAATIKRSRDNHARQWRKIPRDLAAVADRLLDVQIECAPAVDVIRRYDYGVNDTLFYADPPYVPSTRGSGGYKYEMSDDDHEELAGVLNDVKGKAAVSGYRCGLYDDLYRGWHRTDSKPRTVATAAKSTVTRQESLWTNYDPQQHQEEQACLVG